MPASADERPRASVIMPMRNAARYVERSVRSVLAERDIPLELIVVDDGSSDNSRAIVESVGDPRVRVIAGPCQGIAAAFNAGLPAARGDIVMRCDADDLYPAGRIGRQVAWLDAHAEFGAVCGGFAAMDDRGRSGLTFGTPEQAGEVTAELQDGMTRTHFCTFAVRANVLRSTGGMRSFFVTGEDIDLQLRIGEACRVWYSPEVAYRYRIHGSSITHQRHVQENLFFEGLAREFQLQRKLKGSDDLSLGKPPEVPDFGIAHPESAKAHMQGLLIGRSWAAAADGDYSVAIKLALQGVLARPLSFKGWRNLVVALTKLAPHALRKQTRNTVQVQSDSSASKSARTQ